ncbi:Bcr/CflA family efflux MFS transporter [Jatrophihabitans telluris]|uniref:Bcr/CflA family efflux MFS transporter n=1 Tax=Jatrophihabitans telluris TaxID=2038343 RepID=A0ABY4QWX8_9ACTN|nr:Bcr/CflA family efflux MFS transporter [Jatrophihabitans telluris]UQX87420.1 Bcr/CflA family efflux MFS transporter [Jatrophihabitans telluris]
MTPPPRHLVALLAAFSSLTVLTTDVYLPVLPSLGRDLEASSAAAAATVSAVLVGIAVGQLLIGPISDALGRRTPLLASAATYAVAHLAAALAPNIATLLVIRLVAGLATAGCIVVARAIVADVYPGSAAARGFATLSAVVSIVPVLAPVAGGALAHVMSWRGMFVVLAVAAVLLTALGWRVLPETLPPEQRVPAHPMSILRDLTPLLRHRRFLAYVAAMAAAGGYLFGYIGASAFMLQNSFGLSPQQFSFVFALNSVGLFAFSWTTRHLVGRVDPQRLLVTGQLAALSGAGLLALGVARHSLPIVLGGLFLAIACLGLVMPTATALGMAAASGRAGSASGLIGICQFTAGSAAAPLAGIGGSPWSLVFVVAISAAAGLILRFVLFAPAEPAPVLGSPS